MNKGNNAKSLFKMSSVTFYMSSLIFSPRIRKSIIDLYAFVRTADNYVDTFPQDPSSLRKMEDEVLQNDKECSSEIIERYKSLVEEYDFEKEWTEAFFNSMKNDLKHPKFKRNSELEQYIYGSAEVIGFMICAIHKLPAEAYYYGGRLGYAYQMINFIRDISEDYELNRRYFPTEILDKFGLEDLNPKCISANPDSFERFVRAMIERYSIEEKEAIKGLFHLPFRSRIAVRSASALYNWTAKRIYEEPKIVLKKIVKPSKLRAILTLAKSSIHEFITFNRSKCARFERIFGFDSLK